MPITTVEFVHRIGRRARGGDFTKLSMSEQTDLMQAANAALQRLYNALPTYFREETQGFVLPGPLTIAGVGVTQYGKTTTGTPFTDAQFGQSVQLEGDGQWNQIIGPNELLNPYMGTTGTVGGTVYGNACHSESFPFFRVIGNPRYANQSQTPISFGVQSTGGPVSNWWFNQAIGPPQACWSQVFGQSQGKTPYTALIFAPAPDQAYAINVRLSFWPERLTLLDYDANSDLVVPDQFIDTALIPMALQELMSTPVWESRNDEGLIDARGEKGEAFARNQPGQIGAPSNRVFTPLGF